MDSKVATLASPELVENENSQAPPSPTEQGSAEICAVTLGAMLMYIQV